MKRTIFTRFPAMLTGMLLATSAFAADYAYDHNGSRMRVNVEESTVRIYYQEPRKGLSGVGVHAGTLLFDGKMSNGYLEGMSRIFNPKCGEVDYFVYGDFKPGQSFTLNGAAPVLSGMSCRIVDNVYDGPNANLRFEAVAGVPPAAPTQAGASSCVTGVRTSLNVRVGPGGNYGRIGELPANVCGLEILDQCNDGWCVISYGRTVGWVSMRYVRR